MSKTNFVALFKVRDRAVATKDPKGFLGTQLDDIPNASVSGYLSIDELTSEVIAEIPAAASDSTRVVFVKETYELAGQPKRFGYMVYRFVLTRGGWKIYSVGA